MPKTKKTNLNQKATPEQVAMLKKAYESLVKYRDFVNKSLKEFETKTQAMMKKEIKKVEAQIQKAEQKEADDLLKDV